MTAPAMSSICSASSNAITPQFIETLKFQITSRREFDRLSKVDPLILTDLERAARFLYLHSGKVSGRTFGISLERGARFNLLRLIPVLEDIHERLSAVIIENLDWAAFIDRYDRENTLFSRDQFALMYECLTQIKGSFILSINDTPQIRELFTNFNILTATTNYSCGSSNSHKTTELIISNQPINAE